MYFRESYVASLLPADIAFIVYQLNKRQKVHTKVVKYSRIFFNISII